jgi:protocatechuate 3,4-dioxygenase alpha subunit
MTPSPYCTIGPFFPSAFSNGTNDLIRGKAAGKAILLTGRVLEEGDQPTINTILEIWQPDANGIFAHPLDPRSAEADPAFLGWGRARTDAQGRYEFRTVLPGSYVENGVARLPHINVMILAIGLTRRLVTTAFFGDASSTDPVLDAVKDPAARARLIALRDPSQDRDGLEAYRFDILFRGPAETPFFLD